ncbi:L-histidine N(alpha)-methyltransferase [Colwellia sp. E2M01]|uniref:L-histidine N(alpha)-methyltransferase n=1 Tax=Colwellia sp. E2M01 TaxID=2841561 RepID=UPI001C0803A9|nr:L-histidine N(alpha)-methyltransferase [Colwellia sp. E2M01]MBU2871415.1 L-histidine N(alpha)-methyltransferase [Colwellia sp. E2M01]
MIEQFSNDVDAGLSHAQKQLPSKYFYDKTGDALFVKIMALPEYYLTRAEMEIFTMQTSAMISALSLNKNKYFELIELGAGDGSKTKKLLKRLSEQGYQYDYLPIDISENALEQLEQSLTNELPEVSVKTQQGDYFDILENLKVSHHPKVVLFLGSNIGNMLDDEASLFLNNLAETLNVGDKLLLGVDLIKSEEEILPAYNDSNGITREFNLNLLTRINRELGGDFDITKFDHYPHYKQQEGIAKSYLKSLLDQQVTINYIGKSYKFKAGELIHTEISRKYDDHLLQHIIKGSGFSVQNKLVDQQTLFADYILSL